ncbi:hypothetical protein HC891_23970 [Candidatus Gracilibacteria bacterium]|nr:hypothetical protein [Candidatus Gracilibacteria bacterium]
MRILSRTLFFRLTTLLLVGNGALLLRWFLTPPNPNLVDYWFIVYFTVLQVLGGLGLLALVLRTWLKLPWWLGAGLISYPAASYAGIGLALYLLSVLRGATVYNLLFGLHTLLWALSVGCVLAAFLTQHRASLPLAEGSL